MAKTKELREMSVEELQVSLQDTSRELFDLTNELMTAKKIEKPHRIRQARRDRARILTILTEKQSKNKQAGR